MRRSRVYGAALAALELAFFFVLGHDVTAYGEPPKAWAWEQSLTNHSTLVAWWLTWACYPKILIPVCLALLIVAWRFPEWRARIVTSIVLLLLCWQGADFFQHFFARPRRMDWVVKHETSFSYPSSHAAIATGFYALWAAMLYYSDLPRAARTISAILLLLLSVGVCWSRLALGAHYLTDLVGGFLLAVALVQAAIAVALAAFSGGVAGRSSSSAE